MLDLLGRSVHLLLALLGSTAQPQHQVEGGLLLDIVVGEGAAVFELLAGEDEALLVRWDAFLVCGGGKVLVSRNFGRVGNRSGGLALDLGFDVVDGVGRFHLEGDRLAREGLDDCGTL